MSQQTQLNDITSEVREIEVDTIINPSEIYESAVATTSKRGANWSKEQCLTLVSAWKEEQLAESPPGETAVQLNKRIFKNFKIQYSQKGIMCDRSEKAVGDKINGKINN